MVAAPKRRKTGPEKAAKSKVHANVEHVFAHQEAKMNLLIRTIGIKRAEAKVSLANLTYNLHRLKFHERRAAMI
jgi:IS5 family transposase